jgi:hypothetical protein
MNFPILVIFTLIALFALPQTCTAEEQMMLKGKVLSPEHHPVAGAKIFIHDEENGAEIKGSSDGKGKFSIKHAACSFFSFDVIPPSNASLSRAHFQHVSGEAGKHFIVQLHKGFAVTGRVVAGGVGIKGLLVKAAPNDTSMSNVEVVHGGGATRTGRNGEFQLVLTPGQKIIEISNDRYSDLATAARHPVAISGDTRVPDINLPVVR